MEQIKPGTQALENNPRWKGDAAKPESARDRIKRRLPLGLCESCGIKATDRHHKDGNPHNNDLGNIAMLCRRCHMLADGRMEKLQKMNKSPEYAWARKLGGSR